MKQYAKIKVVAISLRDSFLVFPFPIPPYYIVPHYYRQKPTEFQQQLKIIPEV